MKLLVLAQTPPPLHGQSRAVASLLAALHREPDFSVRHVNLPLSRDLADVGRWRPGKLAALWRASREARALLHREGRMVLYYVPAPGKRGALYRDWLVMARCRRWCSALVLHWHAVGLGAWLRDCATPPERWITRRLLGQADLAIVLGEAVRSDADELLPRRCVVVRNGVPDSATGAPRTRPAHYPLEVLFLGLACREKGLFDTLEGVTRANQQGLRCRLTVIGTFAEQVEAEEFGRRAAILGDTVQYLANTSDAERNQRLLDADVLCLPTYYPHEGRPAVLLEAWVHDLPVITTRWRAIPEDLPRRHVHLVAPRRPDEIAAALAAVQVEGPPNGSLRRHFLEYFTEARHHAALIAAVRSLG